VSKPVKWHGDCRFVGQIGQVVGTHHIYGAKLKFSKGETLYIPFENIEIVENMKPVVEKEEPNKSVTKGMLYMVVKKPPVWKTACKFIGDIGKCILIDARGARLRFDNGDAVSFPIDCIKEAMPEIDLNKSSDPNAEELDDENVLPGQLFRVIKRPDCCGTEGDALVGKIGKVKWVNYRAACLKFSDGSGYNVNYGAIERYEPIVLDNPTVVPKKLSSSNIVLERKYKVAKLPPNWSGYAHLLGKMGKVRWASDLSKGAMMVFDLPDSPTFSKLVPFDCLEDLPRPSEEELLDLIKGNPEKILRIIKGLNKITKLKPVRDFVEGGVLPDVTPTTNTANCVSEALLPPTVGEATELLNNHINTLIGPIKPKLTDIIDNPS
jgi:hypothetical protein